MACYNGKNGALSVDGTNVAQLTSWSISESVDTTECTYMGANWKEFHAGIPSWEGSAEAIFADDATTGYVNGVAIGTTVALIAYPAEGVGVSFTGNAVVTSVETSSSMDDVVRVSLALQGTGELVKDFTV